MAYLTHKFFLLLLPLILALAGTARAQPGALDPTFGFGGKVVQLWDFAHTGGPANNEPQAAQVAAPSLYNARAQAKAVARQSDGKILVAGTWSDNFIVSRFLVDGTLDVSFNGGWVKTGIENYPTICTGMALQDDGKIILMGICHRPGVGSTTVLMRFLPSGASDPAFNGVGRMEIASPGIDNSPAAISVQPNGQILLAVNRIRQGSGMGQAVLLRYEADGASDPTFNNGAGSLTLPFPEKYAVITSMAVQKDARILLGGHAFGGDTAASLVLARIMPGGTLDTSFNNRGYVATDFYGGSGARAVAVQEDGRIVVGGWSISAENGGQLLTLLRYLPNGNLDTSFNQSGVVIVNDASRQNDVTGIVIQPDGKVVVGGSSLLLDYTVNTTGANFALWRYQQNGVPDLDFGVNGLMLTDFDSGNDGIQCLLQLPDGKLLAAGTSNAQNSTASINLVRYENDAAPSTKISIFAGVPPQGTPLASGTARTFDNTGGGSHGEQVFTIQNAGTIPLTNIQVATNPVEGPAAFTIHSEQTTRNLGPGETTRFSVEYNPQNVSPSAINVLVMSSDLRNTPFIIKLSGQPVTVTMDAEGVADSYLEDPRRKSPQSSNNFTQIFVPIRLSAPATLPVTVPLGFSGSAKLGKDYNASVRQVTFAPGQTQAKVSITLLPNFIADIDRTVRIELGQPSTPAVRLGDRTACSFTIVDDDRRVDMYSFSESTLFPVGGYFEYQPSYTGSLPLVWTWKKNGVPITGLKTDKLTFNSLTLADGGRYTFMVSNAVNSVTTAPISIGVLDTTPKTFSVSRGANVTLTATVSGPDPRYEWRRDGVPIPKANGKTYTVTNIQPEDADAIYTCRVTIVDSNYLDTGAMRISVISQSPQFRLEANANLPRGKVGEVYRYQIPMASLTNSAAGSFRATGLPPGLTMNSATGIISGTPVSAVPGGYRVTLSAANAAGTTTLGATLLIDPLPANVAGTYTGTVNARPEFNDNLGGRFDMVITSTGAISGRFTLGQEQYPFTSTLSYHDFFIPEDTVHISAIMSSFILTRSGKAPLAVNIYIDADHNRLHFGTLTLTDSDPNTTIEFNGQRTVWAAGRAATAYKGYHTFYWDVPPPPITLPPFGTIIPGSPGITFLPGPDPITTGTDLRAAANIPPSMQPDPAGEPMTLEEMLAEKDSWTDAQKKMDSNIILGLKKIRGQAPFDRPRSFGVALELAADGRVLVDIKATVTPALLTRITDGGGTVLSSFAQSNAIRAWVPLPDTELLAARGDVQSIHQAAQAVNNSLAASTPLNSSEAEIMGSDSGPTTALPQGFSYGSVTVQESTGLATVVGKLADGTAYTVATPVGETGQIPLFQNLYPGQDRGSMLGQLSINPANHAIGGGMRWYHAASNAAGSRNYPAGFELPRSARGGLYTPPVKPKVALDLDPGSLNAQLVFLDTELGDETLQVSIGAGSKVTLPAGSKTTLMITPLTGQISGGYYQSTEDPTHPGQRITRTSPYSGIIVNVPESPSAAYGFSIVPALPSNPSTPASQTPLLSKAVRLLPAPPTGTGNP